MKLYTEELVRIIIDEAREYDNGYATKEDILDLVIPIELPSDEEIEHEVTFPKELMNEATYMFIEGAKWMRDKIINNKEK